MSHYIQESRLNAVVTFQQAAKAEIERQLHLHDCAAACIRFLSPLADVAPVGGLTVKEAEVFAAKEGILLRDTYDVSLISPAGSFVLLGFVDTPETGSHAVLLCVTPRGLSEYDPGPGHIQTWDGWGSYPREFTATRIVYMAK